MKRLALILHFSFFILHSASAAVSPLRSASDYTFEYPKMTNWISGKVMGENGDYSAMRYEDILFLSEAARERLAFAGFSSAQQTNDSNLEINRGYNGLPFFEKYRATGLLNTYMAETNVLSTSARLIETNTSSSVYVGMPVMSSHFVHDLIGIPYSWQYEGIEFKDYYRFTNETFVVQTMTNGVENVFTNRYTYFSNVVTSVSHTNHFIDAADFCMTDYIHPLEEPILLKYMLLHEHANANTYLRSAMTNSYDLLKSAWRLRPMSRELIVTNGVSWQQSYYYHHSTGSDPTEHIESPNEFPTFFNGYKYYVSNYRSEVNYEDGDTDTTISNSEYLYKPAPSGFCLKTDMPSVLSNRIHKVNAFVHVYVELMTRESGEDSIYHSGYCMVPVGQADVVDNGGRLSIKIDYTDSKDIMSRAAAAAGLHVPTYGDTEGHHSISFSGNTIAVYAQIDVKPRSSLPGWPPND